MLALAWTAANIIAVEILATCVVLLVAGWVSGDSLAEMLGLVDPPEEPPDDEGPWADPAA